MNQNDENEKLTIEEEEENFAELLEESFVKPVRFSPGQKVKAVIAKISNEWIFLDLGGKSEGYLDRKELADEDNNLPVKEGDTIEAFFLSSANNELRFTTRITGGDAGRSFMEDAWRSGIPVEGFVEKEIKGGFEVKVAGGLRAFCPYSQVGLQRTAPSEVVGRHLPFRITQYEGKNIVLSNRAVLEEERQRQRDELKESLQEGMKVSGTISSIQNFGAFVNIGAVEGLIPISEISWDRVENVQEYLEVGQEVEVVALKLDWASQRLSFSLKRAMPDPWSNVSKNFPQGSTHSGTVARLTNFGAFINLAPGVDGLLHISRLGAGKRINHPREVLSVGQAIEVKVDSIDTENKRLSLALAADQKAEDQAEKEEDFRQYLRQPSSSMGTLADKFKIKPSGKPGDKKKK